MPADFVSLIEASYSLEGADDAWLAQIMDRARPQLDRGLGMLGYLYDASKFGAVARSSFVLLGEGPDVGTLPGVAASLSRTLTPSQLAAFYRPERIVSSASSHLRRSYSDSEIQNFLSSVGCGDVLSIIGANPNGLGFHIAIGTPTRTAFPRGEREVWTRVSAHITAGYRLRRARTTAPEAVLRPSGVVEHADGPAKSRRARESLREAAELIDRARSRPRRCSPEEAVELWRALIAGRWSLVEHFDADGKRYLLARQNDPSVRPILPELSHRQKQVLSFAAMGHTNKLIGYHLGISTSAAATHLASAARKLGVRSRVAAVQIYRQLEAEGD